MSVQKRSVATSAKNVRLVQSGNLKMGEAYALNAFLAVSVAMVRAELHPSGWVSHKRVNGMPSIRCQ